MLKLFQFVCLISSASWVTYVSATGCTITLPTDLPRFEPVLLSSADGVAPFDLFKPTGEVTTLAIGAKLLLVCPGNSNFINSLNQVSLELTCSTGGVFKDAANAQHVLLNLACKSIPTSTLRVTAETCADNQGYIYEAGFVYNTNQFARVFVVCYDNVAEHTYYTHNIINGATIDHGVQESTRRAFRAEGMGFTTTAVNTFYTINNQISRFETYFGTAQPYVSNSQFMARGHLTPDADFVFSYEQLATYFYMNVAPEFQVINAGNWIRVENLARSLASTYEEDLEIYNGYMGILELEHPTSSNMVPIYLDATNKIEAPLYYFKVIHSKVEDAAIVMITLNNPFAAATDVNEFCTNVCDAANVNSPYFTDRTRGYTFCCTLDDFKLHYDDLPETLTATYLLNEDDDESEPPITIEEPSDEGCTITMPTDIPNPEPVYAITTPDNTTPQLFYPDAEVSTIPVDSNLILHCPGSGNNLDGFSQQSLTLTCQENNVLYSIEKSQAYTLPQLKCTKIPTSELLLTSEPCSNNEGFVFKAGFTLETNDFVDSFSVCYDNNTEHTLYARNIIRGALQNVKSNESTRRAFRAEGMRFTTTATNNFYTNNNQKARFETYFGTSQPYITTTSFLARGHLAPDADFIFGYEQLSTYFYVNAAPEFQVVNAGNWIRVENLARSLATQFGSDLLTFTSTLGILQLPTTANVPTSIYLDAGELIEAPLWYYKILMHPELDTDLVMITLNNPFVNPANVVEFCTNVCDTYGLNSPFFTDTTRGYTFCCTLADFQSSVSGLPTFDMPDNWGTAK